MKSSPESLTRWLLLCSLLGFAYRGHWLYSATDKGGIGSYLDLANGLGEAPYQYRVGVIQIAAWAYRHLHVPFRDSFSVMDFLGSVIATLLAYHLLLRSPVTRRANTALQWFGLAAFLALVLYLMCWQDSFKKVETMPAAALVVCMLWLWSQKSFSSVGTAIALLVITFLLSLIRAELALILSAGVFLVAWQRGSFALDRRAAMLTSAFCMAVAAGTQLYLMKVAYPTARYAPGRFFMLFTDIWRPNEVMCFVIYLLPAAWTLREVTRQNFEGNAAGRAFLFGGIPFIALWMLIGRIEEVRIFLPLALAITPLTVEMAMLLAEESVVERQEPLAEADQSR